MGGCRYGGGPRCLVEKLAQERVILLAVTHGERNEAAQRVTSLQGELVATCRAQDVAEENLPSLTAKAAAADWRWVVAEEQCEHIVHELTQTPSPTILD
jgi:hypothetical protein